MSTVRMRRSRVELAWVGFWLAGVLCGMLLMIGGIALRGTTPRTTGPLVIGDPSSLSLPRLDEETYYRQAPAVQPVAGESHDLPALDEESAYRPATLSRNVDLPRLDEETAYRRAAISQRPASSTTDLPRLDEETAYRGAGATLLPPYDGMYTFDP